MRYEVDVNVNVRGEDIVSGVTKMTVKVAVEADDVEDAELLAEDLILNSVYVSGHNAKVAEKS